MSSSSSSSSTKRPHVEIVDLRSDVQDLEAFSHAPALVRIRTACVQALPADGNDGVVPPLVSASTALPADGNDGVVPPPVSASTARHIATLFDNIVDELVEAMKDIALHGDRSSFNMDRGPLVPHGFHPAPTREAILVNEIVEGVLYRCVPPSTFPSGIMDTIQAECIIPFSNTVMRVIATIGDLRNRWCRV